MSEAIAVQMPRLSLVTSANVRAEAARRGYSQASLARAMGMTRTAMNARWRDQRPWTLDEVGELAELFETSVSELVTDATEKQNPHRWIAPRGVAARPKGLEPPTFWLVADQGVATVTDLGEYRLRRAS